MKVLACGDRHWSNRQLVFVTLSRIYEQWELTKEPGEVFTLIEGQARGADKIAGEWAEMMKQRGVVHDPHPADWAKYGRAAGPIRNREMADENPDLVVAFHNAITESRGTKDMVAVAEERNVRTWLVREEGSLI